MADKKTSQEDAAAALTGAELVRGVQSGGNVKMTTAAIAGLYTPTLTKGDIIARGVSADARVAVGADGLQMVADSTQPQGIKWYDAIGAFATSLLSGTGSTLMSYLRAVTGAVLQTQQKVNDAFVRPGDFGILGDNSTDNTTGFAALATYANTLTSTATTCRVHFPAGIYKATTFPNFAIAGLHLDCAPGVIFKHLGTGVAMFFDGGASGAGVENVQITGFPMVQGNAAGTTTICADFRAFHRSRVQMAARDASTAGFRTRFAVCTDFDLRLSPIGQPAFVVAPTSGFLMDQRSAGEQTSACTLRNPIFEGVSGYGLNLASATQCEIIGGTSEANGGGIFISGSSTANVIRGLDCEVNTTADVFCQGLYNRFVNVLSSTTSTLAGQTNTIVGGRWNIILSSGIDNRFENVLYSTNAGSFTESGSGTIKRAVRNATTNLLDVDICANPSAYLYIDGATGFRQVRGSADKLVSGSANDTVDYKFGAAQHQFWVNNSKNFTLGSGSMGFYGTSPVAQATTAIAAASFTVNSGTAVNTGSTFDGYTISQVVKALRNVGALQ
jgi:hypothetical protein